jgi:hypothetical protein
MPTRELVWQKLNLDDEYLVHLNGDGEMFGFTFSHVPGSELATAIGVKEGELKSKLNEKNFGVQASDLWTVKGKASKKPNKDVASGTFKDLIEKGGRVIL